MYLSSPNFLWGMARLIQKGMPAVCPVGTGSYKGVGVPLEIPFWQVLCWVQGSVAGSEGTLLV